MAIYDTDGEVPAEWEMGDVILDRYEVEGKLGDGGFGTVYKVLHYDFAVELAVKCPKSDRFLTEEDKQNFIREATNWAQLGLHPHIVTCHYVRTIGGIPRIFAEYVAGGTLHDWIRTRKLYEGGHKVALERILDIAIQTAWGLDYAHQRGLVHQDIKPTNVMMTPDGVAKVTDFGLAKARVLATESILVTQMGHTLAYCSPEQLYDTRLGRKTDIWSWAVSVLEMFMGEVTWRVGSEAGKVLEKNYLKKGPLCQDAALLPPMPEEIIKLLRHCFQDETSNRPQNMDEVANRLLAIFQKEMGYNYQHFRRPPEALTDTLADNLNNRAVSLMELGEVQKAEELWEKALEVCPQHIEATFNLEVLRWRQGAQQDDVALVLRLQDVCNSFDDQWLPKYLLALVHFERADIDAAINLLEAANKQAPDNPNLEAALALAHSDELSKVRCLWTLTGHTDSVYSVALSPDGRLALSGSKDKTLKMWDIQTGHCLRTLTGHTDRVDSVAISCDGRFALSGSWDKTLKVWEIETGKCLHTLMYQRLGINSVISRNARFVLSSSFDGVLKVWEVETSRHLHTLMHLAYSVNSIAISPDGGFALSDSDDRTLKVWDIQSGHRLRSLTGHTHKVDSVTISWDGRFALSRSWDKTLKVWEIESGRCLHTFTAHDLSVNSVAIFPDGRFAFCGYWDMTLKVWDMQTGQCQRKLTRHTSAVTSVAISPDGKLALSGSDDKTLKVWELPSKWEKKYTWRLARLWSYGGWSNIQNDVDILCKEACNNIRRRAFVMAHASLSRARQHTSFQNTASLIATWQQLYPVCQKVGLQSAWLVRTLTEHKSHVYSVAISPDGRFALSGSDDRTLKVWEVESQRFVRSLTGHTSAVTSIAISPDGRFALSGSDDKTLKVWESGSCLWTLTGHTAHVYSVTISPNGHFALSGSSDRTIKVWSLETGCCLRTLTGHSGSVRSIAFSPDGQFVLSGSGDNTLKVWNIESGRCLRTLIGHKSSVKSVAISPNGRFALSCSYDRTLKVWDIEMGGCLHTLTGHKSDVNSVAISPDGRFALSASED